MQMYKVMMLPMAEEDIMSNTDYIAFEKKAPETALELAMGFRNTIAKLEFMPKQHELDEDEELAQPEKFIESQEYFSWERYFTKLLSQKTEGTVYKYQKSKLNPVYLHERNRKAIVDSIEGIKLTKGD